MFLQDMLHCIFPMLFNPLFKEPRTEFSAVRNKYNSYYDFFSTADHLPLLFCLSET